MVRLSQRLFLEDENNSSLAQVIDQKGSGHARIGGSFELIDHEGQARTEADYKGKFLLVYFGYTFCPDICPTALYNISQALDTLGKKSDQLIPLFISIDPERDTVKQLALYKSNFNPRIVMLTGSKEQVEKAAKAYRVYFTKAKPDGTSSDYLVDHSSIIYVMDRQGRFVTSFNHETPSHEIVRVLSPLI